jgi:hypothetical protein
MLAGGGPSICYSDLGCRNSSVLRVRFLNLNQLSFNAVEHFSTNLSNPTGPANSFHPPNL